MGASSERGAVLRVRSGRAGDRPVNSARVPMQSDYVLELPSDVYAIERVVDYLVDRCRAVGFDGDRLRLNFRVGLTEALTNAVLYGNELDPSKRVRVEATISARAVTVRVTDEGTGFDPARVPDPTLPANRTRTCGRGIFLIRRLMDRVEYNDEGNALTMVLFGESSRTGTPKARA